MSDKPLMSKMDALLKKHRGSGKNENVSGAPHALEQAPPPDAWLPVLTDLIERGTPPDAVLPAASPTLSALDAPAARPDAPVPQAPPGIDSETLAEQLLSELAPRLSEVMEKQVAAELRRNLDQTVADLLVKLDVNVRDIVREAIAEKLKQPRDPSA